MTIEPEDKFAENKLCELQARLTALGPVAVAVSGGVDSMTLATVAHRVNPASCMYHAVSPAVPTSATERIKRYASQEGWQLKIVDAREIEDDNYRGNPVNRCYFCKSNLYSTLAIDSTLTIVSGTNLDDLSDFRPGLQAAEEHKVVHPYVEVGIDKATLRQIARLLHLYDLHELPAAPCLSSRITTGIAIDAKLLPLIDQVETSIWQDHAKEFSLTAVRCRILPDKISIQLAGEVDFKQLPAELIALQQQVLTLFSQAGFHYREVTIAPYQQGSAFIASTLDSSTLTPTLLASTKRKS